MARHWHKLRATLTCILDHQQPNDSDLCPWPVFDSWATLLDKRRILDPSLFWDSVTSTSKILSYNKSYNTFQTRFCLVMTHYYYYYYYYYYYKCHVLECCHHTVAGALYKNIDLKLLHSSMQTSADHRSRRRHVSHMTDEKGEPWSPSGMSKVRSRPESLVADCSMHAPLPLERRGRRG